MRVQFAPMSSSTIREPGTSIAGGDVEGGRGRVAGHVDVAELELVLRVTVIRAPSRAIAHAGARRASARCGRGSARARSRSSRPTASSPASSTHDLTCADATGSVVLDPVAAARRATVNGGKRPSRASIRAPICAQRRRDAVDRAAADRLVAVERSTRRPRWPASQPGSSRISVPALPTSIAPSAAPPRAGRGRGSSASPSRRPRPARRSACTAASVECVSAASR